MKSAAQKRKNAAGGFTSRAREEKNMNDTTVT